LISAATDEGGDMFGQVEARGIDYIPLTERHGQARELFAVWAAPNVTYLYIVLGGTLVGMGLNAWQAFGVVVAGNLFWALVGIISVSGPAAGAPSAIVQRAMFGVRGNRVNVAVVGWGIAVAYEAINLSVGSLAGFALLGTLGIAATVPAKLAIILVTAIVTLGISVYGHATIVRLSGPFAIMLGLCVAVLACFLAPHVNWRFVPAGAPHGKALLAAAMGGISVIASGPLSWGTGADYARYLPASTRPRDVIFWVALGGFVPSILLGWLGVLAGTCLDMTDPQAAFAFILPHWFYPVFLLIIMFGSISNNVLTAYSSGLALQAVGIKASRAVTVFFDGVVGVALAAYALFVSNFIDALNNILALSVVLLGPSLAIYAMDIVLRQNHYDGVALQDERHSSPFWFSHGFCMGGVTALVTGTAASLACVDTTVITGPVARLLGGANLSTLVGPVVAASVYACTAARTARLGATVQGSVA
jgi:purine-cytosine permease-like protein